MRLRSSTKRKEAHIPKASISKQAQRLTLALLKCLEVRSSATQSAFETILLPFLERHKKNMSMFDEHIGYFCIRSVVCLWKFACPLMGAGRKKSGMRNWVRR